MRGSRKKHLLPGPSSPPPGRSRHSHTCLINVQAGPRRPPGHPARPRSRSPAPSLPHPWRPRGRRSSPGPSDSHPPGYTVPDPDPASAPAPPPPPPREPRLPSRQPLREPRPGRGSANASAPPLAADARPRAGGRGRSGGEGRAGAGPEAGSRTWGAARTAPARTPPPGGAGLGWTPAASSPRSRGVRLSASLEITQRTSQRSGVSAESVRLFNFRKPEVRPLALLGSPLCPLLLIVRLMRTSATHPQLEVPHPQLSESPP